MQEYGGYTYYTIYNHTLGYTLSVPSLKFGNLDNAYNTYYFNASVTAEMCIRDRQCTAAVFARSAPKRTVSPVSTCVTIVGMTARADCRGPNVLKGRTVTTGTPNAQ